MEGPRKAHDEPEGGSLMVGRVRWFDGVRKFGFIARPGEPDVFVHSTAILGEGVPELVAGELVEFTVAPGRKGDQATNVMRLQSRSPSARERLAGRVEREAENQREIAHGLPEEEGEENRRRGTWRRE